METKYCQSCGMPLQKQEEAGTNQDGAEMMNIAAIVLRTELLQWIARWNK